MTGREFYDLFKKGIKLTLVCTECVSDFENQFEKGMIVEVIDVIISNEDYGIEIFVDESNYANFNKKLETPDWYNKDTGNYDLKFSERENRLAVSIIYDSLEEDICNVVVQENGYTELQKEYTDSNSEYSYINWLQEEVLKLREIGNLY